jgi:8-oxo-dGTP diphosphatase
MLGNGASCTSNFSTVIELPFDEMWEDDELWLPQALEGKAFRGFFVFDGEKMLSQELAWT